MSEQFYDKEVAPLLLELANKCGDHGMAFVAVVEYEPGERGTTARIPAGSDISMTMLRHCAHSGANVDGYIIGLLRHAKENGIDYKSSIVLSHYAGEFPENSPRIPRPENEAS